MSSILASERQTQFFRNGLILFYVWILLEGALRKWVLPGLATPLFFGKYAILAVLMVYFIGNRSRVSTAAAPYVSILLFYIFYCVLEQFNMDVTDTPIVGIIGLAVHLGFIPLVFLLPRVITKPEQINKLLGALVWISLPIFMLGMIQYFSPPDSIINKYVSDDMSIAMVGEHARITTVFSYLSGHTAYMGFVMPFLFILVTSGFKVNNNRILLLAAFLLGLLNLLMTGSRGPVGFFIIDVTLLSIGVALGFAGPTINKSVYVVQIAVIGLLGLVVLTQTEQGEEALNSFMGRVESNSDIGGRVEDALDPFKFFDQAGLIGYGIGTTYEANQPYLTGRSRMPVYWEEEAERVVIELGLIGFIISTLTRLAVFIFTASAVFRVRNSHFKQILMVLAILQLPSLIYLNLTIFNWMENIIFWTTAGIATAIYQIDLHEKKKTASLSLASG